MTPFATIGTKSAYKKFGPRGEGTIWQGLVKLRKGINGFIESMLKDKSGFVFDAAYVDPGLVKVGGEIYLLVCKDEVEHRKRIFHRDAGVENNEARLSDARALQEVLITEAKALKIPIVDV